MSQQRKAYHLIICLCYLLLVWTDTADAKQNIKRVIGMLSEQANVDCKLPKKENCKSKRYEVGFVRVIGSKVPLKQYLDQPVIVTGVTNYKIPKFEFQDFSGCDPRAQCRSDTAASSGKYSRKWHYDTLDVHHFYVNKVQKYDAIKPVCVNSGKKKRKEHLKTNPEFKIQVSDKVKFPLTITLHYDGCYGKPGSSGKTYVFNNRSQVQKTILQTVRKFGSKSRGKRNYSLTSLEVSENISGTFFNLDIPIRYFNLGEIHCPKENRPSY